MLAQLVGIFSTFPPNGLLDDLRLHERPTGIVHDIAIRPVGVVDFLEYGREITRSANANEVFVAIDTTNTFLDEIPGFEKEDGVLLVGRG